MLQVSSDQQADCPNKPNNHQCIVQQTAAGDIRCLRYRGYTGHGDTVIRGNDSLGEWIVGNLKRWRCLRSWWPRQIHDHEGRREQLQRPKEPQRVAQLWSVPQRSDALHHKLGCCQCRRNVLSAVTRGGAVLEFVFKLTDCPKCQSFDCAIRRICRPSTQ